MAWKAWLKRIKPKIFTPITVMVVPGANGEIKQVRLVKALIYTSIFFFISLGLFLIIVSITLLLRNTSLNQDNTHYASALNASEASVKSLNRLIVTQRDKIDLLENQLQASDDYYKGKVNEITLLENQLNTLLGQFNKNVKLPLAPATSRGLTDVAPQSRLEATLTNSSDVLSAEISNKLSLYEDLSTQLTSTLAVMDAMPDAMPAQGQITSPFGRRQDPVTRRMSYHKGIDIATATGSPIKAAGTGVVSFSGWSGSYGRVLVIDHGHNYKSVYAHCAKILVEEGDSVKKGDLVAKVGSSGKSTGPHLHFEIHYKNQVMNPLKVLEP